MSKTTLNGGQSTPKPTKASAPNPFSGVTDALGFGLGVDALFNTTEHFSTIRLDDIVVKPQIREVFEDDGNTLADLAASIQARGVLQPILVRPLAIGYELIAGERRFRASRLAGQETIPAFIREMTEAEAEDAQMAENIHRLNLTQIEEAKKIQRDLDTLGSVEAVLAKYQKSASWLSKHLSLLRLPEQAKRLVTENVSADIEVINTVRTIERHDPAAARSLVDELKGAKGQESARAKVASVKAAVKPGKKASSGAAPAGGVTATDALHALWHRLNDERASAEVALKELNAESRRLVTGALQTAFDQGRARRGVAKTAFNEFRAGRYGTEGAGALLFSAFLHGLEGGGAMKPAGVLASARR